jgi:hypothetical protein
MTSEKQTIPIPLVLFTSTIHKFNKLSIEGNNDAETALRMFLFHYECDARQNKGRVYATKAFTMKNIGVKDTKYRAAKNLLIEMKLESEQEFDKKENKYFFKIFISKEDQERIQKYQEFLEWIKNESKNNNPKVPPVVEHQGIPCCNSSGNTYTEKFIRIQKSKTNLSKDKSTSSKLKKVLKQKYQNKTNSVKSSVFTSNKESVVKDSIINRIFKKINKNPIIVKDSILHCSFKKLQKSSVVEKEELTIDPYNKERIAKPKYKYVLRDMQLYNALIDSGATVHRKETKSYYKTMDYIHELLDDELRKPYHFSKNVDDKFKIKIWTQEEVINAFRHYIKTSDNPKYRNIRTFIFAEIFNSPCSNLKNWSPLCKYYSNMLLDGGIGLENDCKKLHQELTRMNVNTLDHKQINRTVQLFGVLCNGYKVPQHMKHLYFDNPIFAFTEHIESKIRRASFKIEYIQGEKFIQNFIDEYREKGILR